MAAEARGHGHMPGMVVVRFDARYPVEPTRLTFGPAWAVSMAVSEARDLRDALNSLDLD